MLSRSLPLGLELLVQVRTVQRERVPVRMTALTDARATDDRFPALVVGLAIAGRAMEIVRHSCMPRSFLSPAVEHQL